MTKEPTSEAYARAVSLVHKVVADSAHKLTHAQMALIARAVAEDLDAGADDAARLLKVERETRALVKAVSR